MVALLWLETGEFSPNMSIFGAFRPKYDKVFPSGYHIS